MLSHMRDMLETNNQYTGALPTKWTYMNQLLFRPHRLGLGKYDLEFICPELCGILSIQYTVKQLSCRLLYVWLL
jgi:hypothetical protein